MPNLSNPDLQAKLRLLDNIPLELRQLNQWVCWKFEDIGAAKPTKVPYQAVKNLANENFHASVNDPQTWCSYEEACKAYSTNRFDGIGFVFTAKDPYTFIDLDDTKGDVVALNRQLEIFRQFDSYSEISPSGQGLHIIIKGDVPVGRKRSFIEIYSHSRYATFTGNVHNNSPIKERQSVLSALWEQMGNVPSTIIFNGDLSEKFSDKEIIEQASNAANGDKFVQLSNGEWQTLYNSQSEADFAFIDIIAFYTQNRNQISRIFRASRLGARDKAKRDDYLGWMVNKSFDKMLPPIDIEGFKIQIDKVLGVTSISAKAAIQRLVLENEKGVSPSGKASAFEADNVGSIPTTPASKFALKPPPGLLGEIAQFIYSSAPRPVPEIAIAAAIGLIAGIAGRSYNVSATGLNQYVLLLANTGSGKEAIQAGISKLMAVVKQQVPTSPYFIGPSEIASGQALYKYMSKTSQCFVSILGEFGLRMLQMSNMNAKGPEVSLRRMLLQLYNQSGFKDIAQPSIYSDADKNVAAIQSPSFSILGESTPDTFYNSLNEEMIAEGLLPRFLLIEYTGPRVPFNEGHSSVQPSFSLIEKLTTLAANAETIQHANPRRVVNVAFTEEALKISKDYDKFCDRQINTTIKDVVKQLWNRAHMKVLKLSGVVAVGINMYDPVIEADHIRWAIDMVNNDIETLTAKFEEGKIGSNTIEIRQVDEITKIIREYIMQDWDFVLRYSDKSEKAKKLHTEKIVTYSYISRRLISGAAFKHDKLGATNAIKRCLQLMIERDYLREVGKQQLGMQFGTTQRAFTISNPILLK